MIRIKKGIDYDAFLAEVSNCSGEVSLRSPDLHLNLKSVLCRYFAMNQVFNNPDIDFYNQLEIIVEKSEDVLKLKDYLEEIQ